jgi:hypothetical protein
LIQAEQHEENPHLRTDYRIAWLTVLIAYSGEARDCKPNVLATYRILGCHPDEVWPQIVSNRKAKLGQEYSEFYDDVGNLIPERLDIPDYDPSCGRAPYVDFGCGT